MLASDLHLSKQNNAQTSYVAIRRYSLDNYSSLKPGGVLFMAVPPRRAGRAARTLHPRRTRGGHPLPWRCHSLRLEGLQGVQEGGREEQGSTSLRDSPIGGGAWKLAPPRVRKFARQSTASPLGRGPPWAPGPLQWGSMWLGNRTNRQCTNRII